MKGPARQARGEVAFSTVMGAVAAPLAPPAFRGDAAGPIPPLENGDRLTAHEFLRRYSAMPRVRKAELIHGIVYMGSPVRLDRHGEPDNLIQGWLWSYSIATPGVKAAANSTTRLDPDDVPQPDALLRILPECGGQSRLDTAGYLLGAPELVVEIAASSVSLDAGDKLVAYRRARVREYLVWRTDDRALDWWVFADEEFRPLPADADGVLRSGAFAGLWLDVPALLAGDGPRVLAALNAGLGSPGHAEFVARLAAARRG